jgi:beta-lactamase class A
MLESPTRRLMLGAALLPFLDPHALAEQSADDAFGAIERRTGGRLGVSAFNTGTGTRLAWRPDERFAMCSTFKFLAVSAILKRDGEAGLRRFIRYGEKDLLGYAPVSRAHVKKGGLPLGTLCAAAIEWSDNTAANLILAQLGGPGAITQFARSLGDPVTRLDRIETDLNTAIPGDPRDTTSPRVQVDDMAKILLGPLLPGRSAATLIQWMVDCKTAEGRLRAGLPKGWRIGSKTGTGGNHTYNEIAIIWPPGRKPLLIASYLTLSKLSDDGSNKAHADVARTMVTYLPGA